MADIIPKFYEGSYGDGTSTNVAQRVMRNLLARESTGANRVVSETGRAEADVRQHSTSVSLEPSILDPMQGAKKVAIGVNKARANETDQSVVAARLEEQYYNSIERAPILPATRLTATQIQERDRGFKLKVQQAIRREQFLRDFSGTIESLAQTRICTRCRGHFSLFESIGAWECRFHYIREHTDFTWDCCGNPYVPTLELPERAATYGGTAFACTPIDHVDFELFEPGVASGTGVWKIPIELRPCFERRKFWKIFDTGTDEDRFLDVWDITSVSDQDGVVPQRDTNMAEPTDEDIDQDEEARVQIETKVRTGRWASVTEDSPLVNISSKFILEVPPVITEASYPNSRAAQESKRYFYVPCSPVVAGPREFLGSSPSHHYIREGPRRERLKELHQ